MPYLKRLAPVPEPIDCKILTAALALFVEKGYHNVSVHQIQTLAKVSIGSIYNHFGGKEGIAKALYVHLCVEFDELVDDAISSSQSPQEQCRKIIELMFEYTESHAQIMAYLFTIRHAEFLSNQSLLCESAGFKKIDQIIKAAMVSGEFRQMDTVVAASCLFGSAIRLVQLRLDGSIEKPLPEILEQTITVAFTGVGMAFALAKDEEQGGSPGLETNPVMASIAV